MLSHFRERQEMRDTRTTLSLQIASARSSSVDVLSITIAEAPVIAQSRVSSVNSLPKASLSRLPPTHSGKKRLKGFKRRFDMMWFVIFFSLVEFVRYCVLACGASALPLLLVCFMAAVAAKRM